MLAKALVPLAFGQGLDTKKDKKQQLYGTLRKAENVVFETLDQARKRNGYDRIVLQTTTGTKISTAQFLAKFKDELLLFDASKLYGFSESLQAMQEKGTVYSVFPTSYAVLNNSSQNVEVDMLIVQGLKVFAYRNATTSEVRYTIQDQTTQTLLVTDLVVDTGARTPKLAAIGNIIFVVYGQGADLKYKTFNITTPRTLSSAVTLAGNYDATFSNVDAVSVGNRVIVAFCNSNPAQRLSLVSATVSGIPSSPLEFTGQSPINALCLDVDSANRLVISYADNATAKYLIYTANLLGQLLAPTTIETVANVSKIACIETEPGQYTFYYGISAAQTYNHSIRKNTGTFGGTVGTPAAFLASVDLASKPFKTADGHYMLTSYDSAIQPTYFLVDASGTILSKISASLSGGHVLRGTLPKCATIAPDVVIVPSLVRSRLVAENGTFYSLTGITNTEIDFVVEDRFQNATLGNNLLIAGGLLQAYDGETVAEAGFNVFPEAPTLLEVNTGTAQNSLALDINAGNYGYCLVYRWTDNQGQEHRSAPSEIVNITVAGSNKGVQITCPTLRLTQKKDVVIEVYRTEAAGTVFYLANALTPPFFNNKATNTVTFLDGRSDANLISGRLLYTTGGVLENIAPPSAKIVTTHTASKRVMLAGLENENELIYSKVANQNEPVEFNDVLRVPIDPTGGPITALASMDEKMVVFERDAIFFFSGSGPNNLGQQDSFTTPERVSTDIGCLDPRSVVLTPDGLMFKSRKGIYLLDRTLGLSYIGSPVEAFNNLTVSSAKVVGELNQVRFTTIDGDCLVYNYVYKFWATFTNHRAKSAEVLGNDYYYLRTDNSLYKENRTSFADAGVPIKMRLEIGWISFQTLQGFGRIYKMLFLGDWLSNHNLLIKVGYDFNEAWTQQTTITPNTAGVDAGAYGANSPYGSPTTQPYGGNGNPYQIRVDFKQQKCQSLKLEIEDLQSTAGEGFSISQITFQVGRKKGLYKLGKAKQFGTS